MAKSTKSAAGKPATKAASKTASKASGKAASAPAKISVKSLTPKLIAAEGPASQPVTISVAFSSGVGQVTACLFRHGLQINMQATTGKDVQFSDVQQGDMISVTGIGTGTTNVHISVPTTPGTTDHFPGNIIMGSYLVN